MGEISLYRVKGQKKDREGIYREVLRNYKASSGREANIMAMKEGIIPEETKLVEILNGSKK